MTDKKQKMIDAFIEKDNILEKNSELTRRVNEAEEKIVELQEESENLKKKRPQLLADCKDISKLNQRLKTIEEEIEILKDTIVGVNEKQENLKLEIREKIWDAQHAFQEYIKEILANLDKKYMKIIPKLIDIMTEYITLESICYGNMSYLTKFRYDDISRIPNLYDKDKPLFENRSYVIWKENNQRLREKYELPDYQARYSIDY
ncbi:hypothetical protein IJ425_02600 [bacterium]|nr:hypothetical protein [bacterium]